MSNALLVTLFLMLTPAVLGLCWLIDRWADRKPHRPWYIPGDQTGFHPRGICRNTFDGGADHLHRCEEPIHRDPFHQCVCRERWVAIPQQR